MVETATARTSALSELDDIKTVPIQSEELNELKL